MCCFTRDAKVEQTSIFARPVGNRQILIYEMTYAAAEPLAMVLPLPVPPGPPEDAVRFINLEGCPELFENLRAAFPPRPTFAMGMTLSLGGGLAPLEVVEVGSYEASFVPSPGDFGRLDERFRLPVDLWVRLSDYRDWGFAVFKLKSAAGLRVHPMAFEFPRRDATRLFFPTLHIHHRSLERTAWFDHSLYCQPDPPMFWHLDGWEESAGPARKYVQCKDALPLFDAAFPLWRLRLSGMQENADTWVGRGGKLPKALEIV